MPVACQIVKPACVVLGMMEKHTGLGLTPFGIPAPNPMTFWMSLFTIYNFLGDNKSATVFSSGGSAFIKRGHDSKYMRPHLSLYSTPLPSVVPPGSDLGLIAVVIATGSAKTTWGPFTIKADIDGAQNPAVVLVPPGLFIGLANFTVCADFPVPLPNLLNVQVPNTVFAGMGPGDIVGSLIALGLDFIVAKILDHIMDWGPIKGVVGKASAYLGAKLSPAIGKILGQKALKFMTRQFLETEAEKEVKKVVEKEVAKKVEKEVEKEVEEEAEDVVMRPMTKLAQKGIGKVVEWGVGKGTTPVIEKSADTGAEKSAEVSEKYFGEGESEGPGHGEGEHPGGAEPAGAARAPGGSEGPGEGHSE